MLQQLAAKLQVGPPQIEYLVALMEQGESFLEFLRIVREFTPQHQAEIMSETSIGGRCGAFAQHFGHLYFPLEDGIEWGEVEEYEQIISYIPIPRMGMSYDDYHDISSDSTETLCLLALVESPYENWGDDGSRVPLLELVSGAIGKELAQRIPEGGLRPDDLQRRLSGTKVVAVALFAEEVWRSTDTVFLDVDWEDDLYGLDWSQANVQ